MAPPAEGQVDALLDSVWARGTSEAARRRVAGYYDRMQVFYSYLWSRTGLHYGFWTPGIRRRAQAVRNMDQQIARELSLARGARVLDAGCGVGGTSLYLAEHHGLDVVGITLSEVQLRRARRLAARSPGVIRPEYRIADYLRTGFQSGSFDAVVGIESVCYAESKPAFLAEAYRLLKPGGRIVVMDGFLGSSEVGKRDARHLRRFLRGLALADLASVTEFTQAMHDAGFGEVSCSNNRNAILPSAVIMEVMTRIGLAPVALPCLVGLLPRLWLDHGLAGISQRRLFANGTLAYCTFTASKPS